MNSVENTFMDIWSDYCNNFRDYNPSGLPYYYVSFPHYMKKKKRKFVSEDSNIEIIPSKFIEENSNELLFLVIKIFINSPLYDFYNKYSLLSIIRYVIQKYGIENMNEININLINKLVDLMYKLTLPQNYQYDMYPKTLFEYFIKTKNLKKVLDDTQLKQIKKYMSKNSYY